jgi:hypothetical protein
MPMVRCNATAWTDETEEGGRLKVLVTRSDPVAGTTVVTEEQVTPRARLTGTAAVRRYMEGKWCERLWQAMPRVHMRKNRLTTRVMECAAKRQCKKVKRQTKALLANFEGVRLERARVRPFQHQL